MSSMEKMPGGGPEKSSKIDFSPRSIVIGNEAQVISDLINEKGGDDYIKRIGVIHALYKNYDKSAVEQKESPETRFLVHAAFSGMVARELDKVRNEQPAISRERAKAHVREHNAIVRYMSKVLDQYDKKEAQRKIAEYWQYQEQYHGEEVEQFKNGIFREVAVRKAVESTKDWRVLEELDPEIDAVKRIDLVAVSPQESHVFFQIKPMEVDPSEQEHPFEVQTIRPVGDPQADTYNRAFQQGIQSYMKEHDISYEKGIGYKVHVSASQKYMNKITGEPSDGFVSLFSSFLQNNELRRSAA